MLQFDAPFRSESSRPEDTCRSLRQWAGALGPRWHCPARSRHEGGGRRACAVRLYVRSRESFSVGRSRFDLQFPDKLRILKQVSPRSDNGTDESELFHLKIMPMKTSLHLIFAFALIFAAGCDKDNSEPQPVSYPLKDYTLDSRWQWQEKPYDELSVIRSQEELAHYITPSDTLPDDINFSENTLLLIQGTTGTLVAKITKNLFLLNETLIFDIDIRESGLTQPEEWRISCLAPRIPDSREVRLDFWEGFRWEVEK